MSNNAETNPSDLAALVARFRSAPSGSAAERTAKDELLDQLQDAVGLSGKMTTEREILRRAEALLKNPG